MDLTPCLSTLNQSEEAGFWLLLPSQNPIWPANSQAHTHGNWVKHQSDRSPGQHLCCTCLNGPEEEPGENPPGAATLAEA